MTDFFASQRPNTCYSPINFGRMQTTYINIMNSPIADNFFYKQIDKITKLIQIILLIPNEIATSSIDLSIGNIFEIYKHKKNFSLSKNKGIVLIAFIGCCYAGSLLSISYFLSMQYLAKQGSSHVLKALMLGKPMLEIYSIIFLNLLPFHTNPNPEWNVLKFELIKKFLKNNNCPNYQKIIFAPFVFMLDFISYNKCKLLLHNFSLIISQIRENPRDLTNLLIKVLGFVWGVIVSQILTSIDILIDRTIMLLLPTILPLWVILIFIVYKTEPFFSSIPPYESFATISIKELEEFQMPGTKCSISLLDFDKNNNSFMKEKWVVVGHIENGKTYLTPYIYEEPEELGPTGLKGYLKQRVEDGRVPIHPTSRTPLKLNQIRRVVP